MSNIGVPGKQTLEDKFEHYLEHFDNLLNKPEADHTKLIDQMLKVVVVLMRTAAKLDKHYSLDRTEEIWVRVHEVKGTYNSKAVLVLSCVSGALSIISGLVGFASAIPGTSLGNSLAGGRLSFLSGTQAVEGVRIHNIASGFSAAGQGTGMFNNIFNEKNQGERTLANAYLEEAKHKHQDRKESHQKHVQNHDRALQHLREVAEKEHRAVEMMQRDR